MPEPSKKVRHEIWNILSSKEYTILIDESQSVAMKKQGKMAYVAVVIPTGVELPPPMGEHAAEDYFKLVELHGEAKTDNILRIDLDALGDRLCGVLGITASFSCSKNEDEHRSAEWFGNIFNFVRMLLSVLKKRGAEKCNVFVEERIDWVPPRLPSYSFMKKAFVGDDSVEGIAFKKASADRATERVNRRISLENDSFSEFFSKFLDGDVVFRFIPKLRNYHKLSEEAQREIPISASRNLYYADLLAWLWTKEFSPESILKKTMSENFSTSLLGFCDTRKFERKLLKEVSSISEEDWDDYFSTSPDSYERFLLDALSVEARHAKNIREKCLEFTLRHLNSKSIDMRVLSQQVAWLKVHCSEEFVAIPKLHLMLLMTELAESNHKGHPLPPKIADQFEQLSRKIVDEDVRLVVEMRLHIATAKTNVFKFKEAKEDLLALLEFPKIALGLQLYGKICSSIGQMYAFEGEYDSAISYFRNAIESFSLLTDKEAALRDIDQTTSYLVISLMDSCDGTAESKKTLEEAMASYLGVKKNDWKPVVKELATSEKAQRSKKYHHHIFLRYLASAWASSGLSEVYGKYSDRWVEGDESHPWELIWFYRGILFAKETCFSRAIAVCRQNGVTLTVIALAVLGTQNLSKLKNLLTRDKLAILKTSMPETSFNALAARINQDSDDWGLVDKLKFFATVLPFNFR